VLQGGLLALNTVTGHVRQVVAQPIASNFFILLGGLPAAMAFYGEDLFYLVLSTSGKAFVNEVDTVTGKVVRVISGPSYHLDVFSQMVVMGNHLFVTDPALPTGPGPVAVSGPPAGAVTEIDAATGRVLRRISGPSYDFQVPEGIAVAGGDLFVADSASNAVTEVDPLTGRAIRVFSGPEYHFESPVGLTVYGDHLFAVNQSGDSVTDIDLGPRP
jgi:hypothetical protein